MEQFAGRGTYDATAPATCDGDLFNCVDMLESPDDLFLVITKVTVTSGTPFFTVGQIIPIHRLAFQSMQWCADEIFIEDPLCSLTFCMLCVANELLLGFVNSSTQIPSDMREIDPVHVEWKDVRIDEIWGCFGNGEVIDVKVIE